MPFPEKHLVEDYIVQKLADKGWKFVPADELGRDSYDEPLLEINLTRALERINKHKGIGNEELTKALNEIKLCGTGIEGSKKILNLYKLGIPIKFEREKMVKYVQLFDFLDIANNEFIVSRQIDNKGRDTIRNDILLYANGIPLVNIECKNPLSLTESWHTAYRQIKDYEKTAPELYKYIQIGIGAESIARYFPIVPWQDEVHTHEWKEEGKDSIDSSIEMLTPDILLDLIQNFLFFRIEFGNATKVIARYMQYRAANKIVARVIANFKGEEDKSKGLVWHWQGSGKTLTMIFAAHKLFCLMQLENPTIVFIVDRIDLKDQLYDEFSALDIMKPEPINSIPELRESLRWDDYRGKRGVFVTLIHKFRVEELEDLRKELIRKSGYKETILNRKNVIAFVDEGHRTQYGSLAAQMKSIFQNAFFFAFTGTPIAKIGRDTYLEFCYPPEELYLDRYFITESIADGFTVKIIYQPRLEGIHLEKDKLEDFLESEFEELPVEIRDDVEERVKEKVNTIRIILENPKRIEEKAEDIARHFKENVDGKFKAMVVAASRKACAIYKEELDKHLPEGYSRIVMTSGREDEPLIREAIKEQREKHGWKDPDDTRKEIIERFKAEELPKILIVTEMLLTGFDAPNLQVMYLDKLLKEHRLLQAVARTNRPFNDVKEAGLVIDYVGILKEYKRALEMYSEKDITGALYSYASLEKDFIELIKEVLNIFGDLPRSYERHIMLKAIELITSEAGKEKEFIEKYKKLRKTFELLGPSELKIEHFQDYKWVSAVYVYYMKLVGQKPVYDDYIQKYYDKTVRLIHHSTEVEKLEQELPQIVFDDNYLKALEERVRDRKEKAANILFTLNKFVLVDRHRNPIYESLVARVERLLEMWQEKSRDYERIYREGARIIEDKNTLSSRQKALGFSDLDYSLLLVLENTLGEEKELIDEIKSLSAGLKKEMFPGWLNQTTARKALERTVRKLTRALKKKHGLSLDEMNNLYNELIESVKNYGA